MSTNKDLQAGALNAWTPIQQAALYHQYLVEQHEKDVLAEAKEERDKEKEEKKGKVRPESVEAGKIVDDLIKRWCTPVYDFLDIFAPTHISLTPFLFLHLLFWWGAPSYLHFLLPYLVLYYIPLHMTLRSIHTKKDRAGWQAWWVQLALVEYLEILFFRDSARSLIWWPKIKTLVFLWAYCNVSSGEGPDRKTGRVPTVFGSIKIIKRWLPVVEDPKEVAKQKEKEKKEKEAKEKEKEAAKQAAKEKAKRKANNSK